MILKNNIKNLLDKKQVSIRQLSKVINMDYSNAYDLVHRESLDNTKVKTLVMIAKFLEIDLEDLWLETDK